ncbi:response regulator [Streptomyces sp. NPDC050560]|uniref:response regulator transcription factor n=1 Tax=Streptomyces sp. NPDC050560 TaxID=3365630 RepID=UPI0037A98120
MKDATTPGPVRVLIADDEALVRTGIRLILAHADGIEVVAEAADGSEAVELAVRRRVDVALLDIRMPGTDGITAAARIASLAPRTACLILTTFGEEPYFSRALRKGVSGFLLKDIPPAELIAGVRSAARGHAVASPQLTRRLFERYVEHDAAGADARARTAGLTAREREVLARLAEGLANSEIAALLDTSEGTVKATVRAVLAKLDCDNRVQAAVLAQRAGLVAPAGDTGPEDGDEREV